MRISSLIFFLLAISNLTNAQKVITSSREVHYDTIYYFIENLRTDKIEYFNLDKTNIKLIYNIKSEEQRYIYDNPKVGTILIRLNKRYYKNLKLSQILKTDFYDPKTILFFVDNIPSSRDSATSIYIRDLKNIEFIKQDSLINEIRLTKVLK